MRLDAIPMLLLGATIAATLLLARCGPRSATLADALPVATAPRRGDARYVAYFVFQPRDCDSHLRTLTLFRRSPVASRVRVAALLLVGTPADLAAVRERYGARPYGAPIVRLSRAASRTFRSLGFSSTPFVVVMDGPRDVALTARVPTSPEQFIALGRLLPTLPPPQAANRAR